MNLPNKLTVFRMVVTIFIIILLLFPFHTIGFSFPKFLINGELIVNGKYFIAGGLFAIAAFTDFLDGYIARKYNLVTDMGKLLDAIADKVLVNSLLIILSALGFITPLIPVIIILRDTVVNSIKMIASSKGRVVAAINLGKYKTVLLMTGIILVLFYNLPFELWNLRVADFILSMACVLSIVSGLEYYKANKDLLFEKKQ